MTGIEYLKYCADRRAYQKKPWLLAACSFVEPSEENNKKLNEYPYCIHRGEEGFYFYDDDKQKVSVDGDLSGPLFYKDQRFDINESWFKGASGETTIGIYLANKIVFWEPFRELVTYHNGLIDAGTCKKVINNLMASPNDDGSIPEGKASVEQCLKLTRQANYLLGMNNVFCKPGSIELLTVDPAVLKLRDELLAKHKDELNDPLVASKIIDEVVKLDTEIMMNGPSKDFFINKGFLDNARKKMFLVFGVERDWNTGEYKFISRPLADGWDLDNITTYINTAVAGSYDRGKATGEGGARVKDIIRLTSRISIQRDDCGSRQFEYVRIFKDTLNDWIGSYYFKENGNTERFDGDRSFIGKIVKMRVPNACLAPDLNYCAVCCGDQLGAVGTQASSECQDIPTGFMLLKMKGMHVSGNVSTVDLSLGDMFPEI